MKQIKLTQNKITLVDDDVFDKLSKFSWYVMNCSGCLYAARKIRVKGKQSNLLLHKEIMGEYPEGKFLIDHIDGDTFNNQKNNLRFATHFENQQNRKLQKDNTSGFKGVYWAKDRDKWTAQASLNGKRINLGSFCEIKDAVKTYQDFVITNFKEFARLK